MRLICWFGIHHGLLRSRRAVALLSSLIATLIITTAGFAIWHNHQSALAEHRRSLRSMGIVLAEQTGRYAQVIDLIVSEVKSRISDLGVSNPDDFRGRLGSLEIKSYLAARVKNVPQADAVALIDANGIILNSSRDGPTVHADVTARDYYTYLKIHDDTVVYIGSLSTGLVTGNLSLFFARRVSGPDGIFLGLVVGVVDVKYLSAFYRAASEHQGQAVTLLRRDGSMLLRYPNPAQIVGVRMPQASPWYARVAEGGGSYISPGVLDGVSRLVSVHPLRDYPLVVDVQLSEAVAFARWRTEATYISAFASAAVLGFSALFWIIARQFRQQAEQNARLEEAAICLNEGQQTLRAYAEMSVDWFWEQDAELLFRVRTNTPFMQTSDDTGKTRWELAGSAMDEERWLPHKADLAARRSFRNFRWERIGTDGVRHFITISGDPVFDRNGVFSGYHGTGREITAEVQAHARLAHANLELELGRRQIEAVLSNITHGVCLFDNAQRLLVWNRRYLEIYNLPTDAICRGTSLAEIVDFRQSLGTTTDMTTADYLSWRAELGAKNHASAQVVTLRNGRIVVIHYQPMPDGGWVATHEDVTERQQAEANIAFMAHHDALTRLANRVLFRDRLEWALGAAGRGSEFAVICLDLDHFKTINDTLGHPVGDGVLQGVAGRLQACVREGDTVARLGGDEFAIIQLAVEQPDHVELLTSRIIRTFSTPFEVEGHQIMVGISAGVAVGPADGATSETLLRNADVALYLAKAEGRGTVRFFEPEMDARIQARRTLERDLRDAILHDEFELFYQPLINLASGNIAGFEALLRWHHPIRGLVSPADFIPLAEETGMIIGIGAWVLRMACFEAISWPAEIGLAVNLSPVQFKKGDLIATVREALEVSGLQADRLELEITESVLLHESVGTVAALHQLRAMGIAIALDDFGTGYSSLSYLRSFPFDKIKIDQSFVRDLVDNKESMSIIRAVTGLGHSLSMTTTAEGVETLEQLDKLRQEGCTEVQGYLFSRPRAAADLPELITKLQQVGEDAK